MGAYLALLRPKGFLPAFLFVMTGYALSHAHAVTTLDWVRDLSVLFFGYVVCLSGGSLAFNSAFDRDTGPVNFLDAPPPPPPHLAAFGVVLTIIGTAILWRGPIAVAASIVLALMSIVYSAPLRPGWRRGKEIAVLDNVLQALAYGLLSVLVGYGITRAPLEARVWLIGAAFTVSVFGAYAPSQIFQMTPETTYAEAKNFASYVGPAAGLRIGAACYAAAVAFVLAAVDWHGPLGPIVGSGLFTVCFGAAIALVLHWSREPFLRPKPRLALMYRLLLAARTAWIVGQLAAGALD